MNLVEVARRAGVKRVVLVSSIGADEPFFPLNLLFGVRTSPMRMLTPFPAAEVVLYSQRNMELPCKWPCALAHGRWQADDLGCGLQVLFWKKRGEEALQRSGLPYTIVRPGGLLNEPRQGQLPGNIVMAEPATFGLPPKRTPGSILRSQVGAARLRAWHAACCMRKNP